MIFSLVAMSALSQVSSGRPTLIVGISIDQLRGDYLDLLQSQFGNGGFKRLMAEGAHLDNVVFDMAQLDKTTSTAVIYTGTYIQEICIQTNVPSLCCFPRNITNCIILLSSSQ